MKNSKANTGQKWTSTTFSKSPFLILHASQFVEETNTNIKYYLNIFKKHNKQFRGPKRICIYN
jgi:hypothetical protein